MNWYESLTLESILSTSNSSEILFCAIFNNFILFMQPSFLLHFLEHIGAKVYKYGSIISWNDENFKV